MVFIDITKYKTKNIGIGKIKVNKCNLCFPLCISALLIFKCFTLKTDSNKTAAIPPTAKHHIRLSISNPVFRAKLNKDGGLQYSRTNRGSVKPNGAVKMLAKNISFLDPLTKIKITIQINRNIELKTNQGLKIPFMFIVFPLNK